MDFKKLFETQKVLDEHITDEHPELKGQDNLNWKTLALQVELGECANEWRGFKKWSKDQEPRNYDVLCHACKGEGMFYWEHTSEVCAYCSGSGYQKKNPLLEEYVDCLHFILSIGLEMNIKTVYENILPIVDERLDNVTIMFHQLFACTSNLYWSLHYKTVPQVDYYELFQCFIKLGEMLGFAWDQIEEAYFAKNAVNHQRQEQGY
jgi:dimeric dUTPase (all-alpha-NTP-PPase superfamily)